MKTSLPLALLTVLSLLIAFTRVHAQVSAPRAADVPDIRILDGAQSGGLLDLDDFVVDYDHASFLAGTNLDWTDSTRTGAAPPFQLTNNILSVDAGTVGDVGAYEWVVRDASGLQDTDTSAYRASSAIGLYPAVSNDALLSPQPSAPLFTYVMDAPSVTGALRTEATGTVVSLGSGVPDWQSTYINAAYDASRNGAYHPRATIASGTGTVTIPGLDAGINGSGLFTLTSTGAGLSEPVLIAFKGKVTGNGDYAAVSALVSNALLSTDRGIGPAAPELSIDDGFETANTGEIARVGFNQLGAPPNRREGSAHNTWVSNVAVGNLLSGNNGYVSTHVIGANDLPPELQDHDFPGDHAGQVLQIQLEGVGGANGAFLLRNAPVPADPGYAYAVQMSLATDAATPADLPNFRSVITTFGFTEIAASNYGAAIPNASGSAPLQSEGWVRIRSYLEPSAAGLGDISPGGLTAAMILTNPGPDPVNVYVDNVSIYKTILPNDASFGASPVTYNNRPDVTVGSRLRPHVNPSVANLGGQFLYGNFENGTGPLGAASNTTWGANTNGWLLGAAPSVPTGVTISVGPSDTATQLEAGDGNWITTSFNAPAADAVVQILSRVLTTDATGSDFAPGIYVMSADYFTPAGSDAPATVLAVTDDGFTNYAYYTLGNSTRGAVRRVQIPVALRDVDNLRFMLVPTATAGQSVAASFDNVMLERVEDRLAYWDASLVE